MMASDMFVSISSPTLLDDANFRALNPSTMGFDCHLATLAPKRTPLQNAENISSP